MSNKIDIRIVKLAKWEIPKSKSIFDYKGNATYMSIGYFDMIDVKQVQYDKKRHPHPLSAAYDELHRVRGMNQKDLENYSIQELIVFAKHDENEEAEIEEFWAKDTLLMFVSMIHVDNEGDIDKIVDKIKELFADEECLYYFSFDYSGIVLFAKGISIEQYLEKMFKLNYENAGQRKLIRDSYSLYGFNKQKLNEYFEQFKQGNYECQGLDDNEKFSISVNIGVQNYNTYKDFRKRLEIMGSKDIQHYGLYGRHDVSIVNDNATMKWLLYVQYLMNEFTTISDADEKKNKEEKLFSTHETFVKIALEKEELVNFEDTTEGGPNEFYLRAKKQLQKICDEFFDEIERHEGIYNGEYKVPVQAVQHSILSILKNRYAEDFVLCMYQSFCEFVSYLTRQISESEHNMNESTENASEFEVCFDHYFQGLNSLVNSAMHSERQFVQATSFNAVIYDIPSKIMAFYVAIIQMMQQIIKGARDRQYTFLLTPSFHNEIVVKVISFYPDRAEIPTDRILMVKINEKSLYNPGAVIRRMAHEIAHFVGDDLRCRKTRKKFFKFSLIHVILRQILYSSFIEGEEYNELAEQIFEVLSKNLIFVNDKNNYSKSLARLVIEMPYEFMENELVQELITAYINNILRKHFYGMSKNDLEKREEIIGFVGKIVCRKAGSSSGKIDALLRQEQGTESKIELFTRLIMGDINCELQYLSMDRKRLSEMHLVSQSVISKVGKGPLNTQTLKDYAKVLLSSYTESFADLQMILLTGIEYFEYLNGFVREENLDVRQFHNSMADISRISMVAFVLHGSGIWNIYKSDDRISKDNALQEFHQKILLQIDCLKQSVREEDFERLFFPLKKKAREFFHTLEDVQETVPVDYKANVQREQSTLLNITNLYLVYYLVACTNKSLEHYGTGENGEAIDVLRKIISEVVDCDDIEVVFRTICQEINQYKNSLARSHIEMKCQRNRDGAE